MDKIKELIAKALNPVIILIGKLSFKKEKVIGVVLRDKQIQICEVNFAKDKWKVINFSNQEISGIGQDQDIYSAATYLSDQVKNAMSSIKTNCRDVAISLDPLLGKVYNLQIPIMDDESLNQNIEMGGFWEQFDETPETLEGYEISHQVMFRNPELEVMEITLVAIETKLIEAYSNIFRLAGYNPIIIDLAPFAHINTQSAAIGKENFDIPSAVLTYTTGSNFLIIASNKSFQYIDLNIIDADTVLLDTVEEIESVENEFWDEIFERVGGQIKQSLIEFETKNDSDPISVLNIITDKSNIKNFSKGLERQLGDIFIKQFDPKEIFDFSGDAEKYLDSLKNSSLISESIGIAIRKINPFNLKTNEIFSINLISRSKQLKINRKSMILGKASLAASFLIVFITLIHVLPFKVPKSISNAETINKITAIKSDLEQKKSILKGYTLKKTNIEKQKKDISGLGSNILTTANIYTKISTIIPKTVRFSNLDVLDKDKINIAGVAKDDQSVIRMMNSFAKLKSIKQSKIESLVELSNKDRIELYAVEGKPKLKLEELPKETINKKFTVTLTLNPIDEEKFDDDEILEVLKKRTKK